ncbi:MAG: hypothetical protein SVO01_00230 [Thermotogota bacterium]|nr:hypothetical protein [Thermotogota bacterium]
MSFNGFKNYEIAERLELTESSVSIILNSPLGKAYMEGLQDKAQKASLDVRKELISMNKKALDTFKRLLDPTQKAPASVQYNTAKDILDRTGYKASDKIDINMNVQNKTDAELEAEIARYEESIKENNYSKIEDSSEDENSQNENIIMDDETEIEVNKAHPDNNSDDDPDVGIPLSEHVQNIIKESQSDPDKEFDPFKKID